MAKRASISSRMPLDIDLWQRQAGSLSPTLYKAYMEARIHQWREGSLPASLEEVAEIMRLRDVDPLGTALALLKRFFTQRTDGSWAHGETQSTRTVTRAISESYRRRSVMANQKRWANHVAKRPTKNPAYVRPSGTPSGTPVVEAVSSTPPLPSQAQGNSPLALVPPARSAGQAKSASHRPPGRKAAKRVSHRKRPAEPAAPPQPPLPLSSTPESDWRGTQKPQSEPSGEPATSVFTPSDPRFDPVAKELRNVYWREVMGHTGVPCRWINEDKAALSKFLRDYPGLLVEQIGGMFAARFQAVHASKGHRGAVSAAATPAEVFKELHRFADGPVNNLRDSLAPTAHDTRW